MDVFQKNESVFVLMSKSIDDFIQGQCTNNNNMTIRLNILYDRYVLWTKHNNSSLIHYHVFHLLITQYQNKYQIANNSQTGYEFKQQPNDAYQEFMNKCLQKSEEKDYVTLKDLMNSFKKWFSKYYPSLELPHKTARRKNITSYMELRFGKKISISNQKKNIKKAWMNLKIMI